MCGLFLQALRISSPEYLNSELDVLRAAFRKLGYPLFLICEALSSAKTKFYASPPTPLSSIAFTSTSNTTNYTNSTVTLSKTKVVVMPYHQDFVIFNKFIHNYNLKLFFSSRYTIWHAVVDNKHLVRDSTKQPKSGVYCISCTSPGCNQIYYGRTINCN